jgi:2-polyprenyl-6-methoxyphenol hydroxylase-like FAD-dependent oxidoreductase
MTDEDGPDAERQRASSRGREAGRYDVVIVGAGAAGAALACVLGRTGLEVALVDRKDPYPRCFKAEKVEPDQAELLRAMDLFEGVRPVLTPIPTVASGWRGRVLTRVAIEQYGVDFWDLANAIRAQLPERVDLIVQRVRSIDTDGACRRVSLASGDVLEARLVVLSAGVGTPLYKDLGIEPRVIRDVHSMCFGFDVELGRDAASPIPTRAGRDVLGFDSLTYYSEHIDSRFDYLTLFPIGDRWRANLFAYVGPRDDVTRALSRETRSTLATAFPRIDRVLGGLRVTSRVEGQVIDLYDVPGPVREGLLLVGDSHQSVCPATGTGLSKVLTDVQVASEAIPVWLDGGEADLEALRCYYEDPRKLKSDAQSLEWAAYRRQVATEKSLRWTIHRLRSYARMAFGGDGDESAMS